jgi:ribosomal protein S18 acetylase RimI-like enzyme
MRIREARAGDAEAVAEVFLAARAEMTYLPRRHGDDDVRAWIRERLLPSSEVWVGVKGGRAVAFAALGERSLDHLYVHPGAQNRGAGSRLLALAKELRPRGLELWVFQRNDGARRFYERHGFALVRLTDGAGNEEREPDALYAWFGG